MAVFTGKGSGERDYRRATERVVEKARGPNTWIDHHRLDRAEPAGIRGGGGDVVLSATARHWLVAAALLAARVCGRRARRLRPATRESPALSSLRYGVSLYHFTNRTISMRCRKLLVAQQLGELAAALPNCCAPG